jgi:hypothetical protein
LPGNVTVDNVGLARAAELSLIAADARFFRDLALAPHLASARPVILPALMPIWSMFIVESASYLARDNPGIKQFMQPHEELLQNSRNRFKLLDDSKMTTLGVLKNVESLAGTSSDWFLEMHHGPLSGLKRWLQLDLGMYFVEGDLFCTTQAMFIYLGLTEKSISENSLSLNTIAPFVRKNSEDFGRYLGLVLRILGLDARPPNPMKPAFFPNVLHKDLKSKKFYQSVARVVAPGHEKIAVLLILIVAHLNTARIVTPLISNESSIAQLKIKLISLYHGVSGLSKLLQEHQQMSIMSKDTAERISALLQSEPIVRLQTNKNYRFLRDTLIHYGINKGIRSKLSPSLDSFGLIEAYFPGTSTNMFLDDIDAKLKETIGVLYEILPRIPSPEGGP